MNLKCTIGFFCVIAVLLVPTVVFGEIITTGNWSGQGGAGGNKRCSYVWAYADGDTPFDYGLGQGWESTYTTEAGDFDWSYYVFAYAEATLTEWDGQSCAAQSQAYAHGSCDHNPPYGPVTKDAYVYIEDSGHYWGYEKSEWDDGGGGWTASGIGVSFEANEGVDTQHSAFCQAGVYEDSAETASADANAQAPTYMHVH